MTKRNIEFKKTFIDAWQTDINNIIYIKIIKNISLIVIFVNEKDLTEKKKYYILYECQYFLKILT